MVASQCAGGLEAGIPPTPSNLISVETIIKSAKAELQKRAAISLRWRRIRHEGFGSLYDLLSSWVSFIFHVVIPESIDCLLPA